MKIKISTAGDGDKQVRVTLTAKSTGADLQTYDLEPGGETEVDVEDENSIGIAILGAAEPKEETKKKAPKDGETK